MILSANKTNALVICLGSYLIVLILCVLLYQVLEMGNPAVTAAMLDLAATILIFLVSLSFNNSSFYDPFWSIAPVPKKKLKKILTCIYYNDRKNH